MEGSDKTTKALVTPKTTQNRLTLKQKVDIIQAVDNGERKMVVARRWKLNESTVRTIYSNRAAILASVKAFGSGDPSSRHRVAQKCLVLTEKMDA